MVTFYFQGLAPSFLHSGNHFEDKLPTLLTYKKNLIQVYNHNQVLLSPKFLATDSSEVVAMKGSLFFAAVVEPFKI